MDSEDHSPGGAGDDGDCCSWMDHPLGSGKGRDGDKKRRFSEEQIKSLESMFETQTKLEPRQKLQLARELGLQPRQVAIWFQNKRARWKSKQLEREYNSLRADYDALLSSYESLKKEKQLLVKQLQNLTELVEKPAERNNREAECNNHGSDDFNEEQKPSLPLKQDSDLKLAIYSDEDYKKLSYFSEEEPELYSGQPTSSSLTSSAEQQFCFQSPSWAIDHTNNTQWWEVWPMNEYLPHECRERM